MDIHAGSEQVHSLEEKLLQVQSALKLCESEKVALSSNLSTIKQAVEQSFKRHIGTLQCRAKWLACHADSIFHLKEGSLNQQITELRQIASELHSCLQKEGHQHQQAGNILENVDRVSLQPCEGGSMLFVAEDNLLEEMIIGYGDIDTDDRSIIEDCCDLLSDDDEGVFVVERSVCPQQQQQQLQSDSIEMKVKSIEMHHLTTQSANNEKEDFERIEMDVYDCTGLDVDDGEAELKPVKDSSHHEDSGVEEETESSDYGEWLHPRGSKLMERDESKAAPPLPLETTAVSALNIVDFHKESSLNLEMDRMSEISESKKVPLWLKKCQDPPKDPQNPWIRGGAVPSSQDSCPIDGILDLSLADACSQLAVSTNNSTKSTTNVAMVNDILFSSNTNFLRNEDERPLTSLSSGFSLIDLAESTASVTETKITNTEQFDSIFKSESSEFLRSTKLANNSDNISNNTILPTVNKDLSMFLMKQNSVDLSVSSPRLSSAMEANITHISGILDSQSNQFLVQRDKKGVRNLPPVRPSKVVNYLRSLESKPNSAFLRSSGKRTKFDADMCEWLRSGGPSVESCMQCSDVATCEMSGGGVGLGAKWVKTATDW